MSPATTKSSRKPRRREGPKTKKVAPASKRPKGKKKQPNPKPMKRPTGGQSPAERADDALALLRRGQVALADCLTLTTSATVLRRAMHAPQARGLDIRAHRGQHGGLPYSLRSTSGRNRR